MKLSKHFTEEELMCRCRVQDCPQSGVEPALIAALEDLRTRAGNKPIRIRSGFRCVYHPVEAKKANPGTGRHSKGQAADISITGYTARELYVLAVQDSRFRGLGVDDEQNYIHVDIRPEPPARWCYRNGKEVPWFNV